MGERYPKVSFSLQALSAEYLTSHGGELRNEVYEVPPEIDRRVAELKLKSMGVEREELTPEQLEYLRSWKLGT